MDIVFTIMVWLGLAALTVYGLRLIAALEQAGNPGDDVMADTSPPEPDRVLVGAGAPTDA